MEKLKVAFVGAGRRMRTLYLPILRKLSHLYEPVGITTRNRESGEAAGSAISLPWYPDFASLASAGKPDLAVICVPGKANVRVADRVMASRVPFLMETPISHELGEARAFVKRWKSSGIHAGVTEQKPFLPMEQFKRMLIRSGSFGKILVVQNDFRSLDYHAIAQLRIYLAPDTEPESIQSQRLRHAVPALPSPDNPGSAAGGVRWEDWDLSTVRFGDGSVLVHHFTSLYKTLPYRTFQSLRIYGDRGTMVNGDVAWLNADGATLRAAVSEERDSEDDASPIRRLSIALPDGTALEWLNPHPEAGLTDDEVGLALHFERMGEAIRGKGRPLYDPSQALLDSEIMAAIRMSGMCMGKPIGFPFRPTLHKAGWLLRPGNWPRVLERISGRRKAKKG